MSTALMIEIFGYIGCIFVIISMLMTSVVKLRVINTVGSSISAVYADIPTHWRWSMPALW